MTIGITGATGFIGRRLTDMARRAGHEVIGFSRHPESRSGMRVWQPVSGADFTGLEAVVHLAGESLLGLWTRRKRQEIRRSRGEDTRALVARLRQLSSPPHVLVSAGGCAYYGDGGDGELTELSPPGTGFIAEVAREWEAAALEAADFTRVVTLRTGMVLGTGGGAAPVLCRIFRCGLGGRLGNGRQWQPWIEVMDMARLILHAVECESLRGPVNAVAPGLVRNAEFTKALAGALHRPAVLPVPGWILRRLPGGMSDVFLHSQRVVPAAARDAGFSWDCPAIATALQKVCGPAPTDKEQAHP